MFSAVLRLTVILLVFYPEHPITAMVMAALAVAVITSNTKLNVFVTTNLGGLCYTTPMLLWCACIRDHAGQGLAGHVVSQVQVKQTLCVHRSIAESMEGHKGTSCFV